MKRSEDLRFILCFLFFLWSFSEAFAIIKIIVHKKSCNKDSECKINQVDSKIQEELLASIIKKAALIDSIQRKKKK